MSFNLFVYGSLISSKVINIVIGKVPSLSAPGILSGYHRYRIINEVYPAITVNKESSVNGVIYYDLSSEDIEALDRFEGNDYKREEVLIDTNDSKVKAFVYVWSSGDKSLLYGEWKYDEHFIPNESLFINQYAGFQS